ncbi:MAG TPA: hypothetical protein VFE62_28325, partial [Gemmataceae bacterium]|nr:hypothetical protein [Gemmataceae bacterium]
MASALARCRGFLNYHPLAKWLSILSSVGTTFLYVGLIVLLAFFIDLMVDRGEIPAFHQLPAPTRQRFLEGISSPDDERKQQVQDELKAIGFDPALVKAWANGEPMENWSQHERALLWWGDTLRLIHDKVPAAADATREKFKIIHTQYGAEAPLYDVPDCGILSLVIRWRFNFGFRVLAFTGEWNSFMWEHGNTMYLLDLFLWALGLATLRLIL